MGSPPEKPFLTLGWSLALTIAICVCSSQPHNHFDDVQDRRRSTLEKPTNRRQEDSKRRLQQDTQDVDEAARPTECCELVTVAGDDSAYEALQTLFGSYAKVPSDVTSGGRSVYYKTGNNPFQYYLYYWSRGNQWTVGPKVTEDGFWISTNPFADANAGRCPYYGAHDLVGPSFAWYYLRDVPTDPPGPTTWRPSGASVECEATERELRRKREAEKAAEDRDGKPKAGEEDETSKKIAEQQRLAAERTTFELVGVGIAGPGEMWNVGNAAGRGAPACFAAVMADVRCNHDYFSYVTRGDKNCGCKTESSDLIVRGVSAGDYFKISLKTLPVDPFMYRYDIEVKSVSDARSGLTEVNVEHNIRNPPDGYKYRIRNDNHIRPFAVGTQVEVSKDDGWSWTTDYIVVGIKETAEAEAKRKTAEEETDRTRTAAEPEMQKSVAREMTYEFVGAGVAGPGGRWNVGNARGQGVEACFAAVIADHQCSQDFFTYVTRGDKNCGCKTGIGDLSVRDNGRADYYKINLKTSTSVIEANVEEQQNKIDRILDAVDPNQEVSASFAMPPSLEAVQAATFI